MATPLHNTSPRILTDGTQRFAFEPPFRCVQVKEADRDGGNRRAGEQKNAIIRQFEVIGPAVNARIEQPVEFPVVGDRADIAPLCRLQNQQARARFSSSVVPPCLTLMT